MTTNNVVIIISVCQHINNTFGIRLEEFGHSNWIGTWAFAIRETVAQREGYDKFRISGSFSFNDTYPGCPYCKARSAFMCSCGKIVCWDGSTSHVHCPICKQNRLITGSINELMVDSDA